MPLFVRASQLSSTSEYGPAGLRTSALLSWLLHLIASAAVTCYDVMLRLVMPSWYLMDLDQFGCSADYLIARAEKKTRRYIDSATEKFVDALSTGQIFVRNKAALDEEDFEFARSVFCGKHGKPWLLYAAWRAFVTLLSAAPHFTSFTTVVDASTGSVLAVFVEFRQGTAVHHFITALVDHDASKQYGIYVAKYDQMLNACTQDGVFMLRMGPTTDALKASMGGLRLPLFVVASPVWLQLQGRCNVVAFGIFTTIGLFAFMCLTQWQMDASGMGRLTSGEYVLMYACCMVFVKVLPLWSIGLRKILSNPRKYLLQTSFYAQGVVFGGVLFIVLASMRRGINPLCLLDALCMFAFVGDGVGRVGCHFYGCCFGRPYVVEAPSAAKGGSGDAAAPFNPWAVMYLDKSSSVTRMRPELRLQPLLPTQLLQALFAATFQAVLLITLAYVPHVKTGLVGCFVLGTYSIGRAIFFLLREDEKFKSQRSFTTAYIALGTLAACALLAAHTLVYGTDMSHYPIAHVPSRADLWSYVCLSAAISAVNMLIQGLHHHEGVGRFPDLAALLAPPSFLSKPAPRLSSGGRRMDSISEQVWSTWQANHHVKEL